MDSRERWQALQARITAARTALAADDRTRALHEIESALAIDPEFLAAQVLRDRILAGSSIARPAAAAHGAGGSDVVLPSEGGAARRAMPPPPGIVSAEGFARFEERARRRRVDRRLDAARAALAGHRLREASAALEEVAELDPNLPELTSLERQLDMLLASRSSRVGPWLAAAAVFGGVVLGASWLEQSGVLVSRPVWAPAPPLVSTAPADEPSPPLLLSAVPAGLAPDVPMPAAANASTEAVVSDDATGTAGEQPEPAVVPAVREVPVESSDVPRTGAPARSGDAPVDVAAAPPPPRPPTLPSADAAAVLPQASIQPPPAAHAVATARLAAPPEPIMSEPAPAAPVVPTRPAPDEEMLVKQALQRYRSAYEGLDAHSAQAVWPAVDEAALARAFDGLESQHLTFDVCTVQLGGDRAAATCRGTTRYVPKVGSRQPRTEPRLWTFALHKTGDEWKIDAARAER